MDTRYLLAETVERSDVRVSRDGWVRIKECDSLIGVVTADVNAAGRPIWRANAGDIAGFAFTRKDAIATVLNLHNMQEKARAYESLARVVQARQEPSTAR